MSDSADTIAQGSPFWRFSLALYRQSGVADACIALQETSGVDVNLLLFLLWQASQKRALSEAEVTALEARIGPWRDMTVVPLRAVRRALRSPPALVASATAEGFRTRIKAVELEAERLQQQAMYNLSLNGSFGKEAASAEQAAHANIAAYEAALAVSFAGPAVAAILAAFVNSNSMDGPLTEPGKKGGV